MSAYLFAMQKEIYKIAHRRKYFVMLILGAAVCALRWGGAALMAKITGGVVVIKSNMTIEMLPFVVDIFIPIVIFMAVTDLFSGEYAADTLKACLMKPVTRFKLLSAKISAVSILAGVMLIAMYVVCMIVQFVSGSPINQWGMTLAAYVIDFVPLVGVVLLAVLINVCINSTSAAMLLMLAVYVVMKYFGGYVAGAESFLFTAYSKWHSLFLGVGLPLNVLIHKIGILFGSMLILFSVSYIIFDRKDI